MRILKQKNFSSRKSSADAAEEETEAEKTGVTTETDAAAGMGITTETDAVAEEAAVIGADVTAGMGVTIETDVTAEEATAIRTDAMTEKDTAEETGVTVEKEITTEMDAAVEDMTAGSRAGTAVTRRFASRQRSKSQYQFAAMLLKPSACVAVVRIHGFHSIPESGGVIHVCQMTQLLDDDVIQNLWRR